MKTNERFFGGTLVLIGLVGLLLPVFVPGIYDDKATMQEMAAALDTAPDGPRTPCRVLTVYDGDTVGCDLNGNGTVDRPKEQIRFLGIDTPEMHYSRKNASNGSRSEANEPFAAEASAYIIEHTQDQPMYLEFDQQQEDVYGRTLAYAYLEPTGGTALGEQLLERGYATILMFEPNTRFQAHYKTVEAKARAEKRGLWGG